KVFFTLQEELLKPQVQVNFKPAEGLDNLILRRRLDENRQRVARVLFAAARPKPPARWEVNPEHARRQKLREVAQRVGQAIFQWAVEKKPVLLQDPRTKDCQFRPNLLDELVTAGRLAKAQLLDPTGDRMTLRGLARAMPHFTADQFGQA